ncbi:uncharacterized protein LOC119680105 [Teleopsis dalmanni]|uniref:uncharacterized protein LOC119680105 n=1 Tax=Teleopsis dalmanni TaxID=139649 RepID=UPI0018CE9A56|nr:uncharacterized protein LOC119680105 [Teleopsis dalmanni]
MPLSDLAKIAIGWSIVTFAGIYAFVVSKDSIIRNRYESMQVRQRMKKANIGDYEKVGNRRFN